MSNYIDAEKAFEEITDFAGSAATKGAYAAFWKSAKHVRAMPADPDVVKVVRCKDCTHWKPGDSWGGNSLDDMQRIGGCPIVRFARRENDFCCEGERRTDHAL